MCIDFDSHPLCLCMEGLVGDGIECTFPSELQRYDSLQSAHELAASVELQEECFAEGNIWPEFIAEKNVAPYPDGMAPYATTSCGNTVCPVGWKCKNGKCKSPKSTDICQNSYSEGQCNAHGCCKYKKGKCKKKGTSCPAPKDPGLSKCSDKNTCCYFSCNHLEYEGDQISQNTNAGISPYINGVVHSELYLVTDGYYSGGEYYGYDDPKGAIDIKGDDKNMFDRCFNACWVEDPKAVFLSSINKNDVLITKTCSWLKKQSKKKRNTYCDMNNLSKGGYKNAYLTCPDTCESSVVSSGDARNRAEEKVYWHTWAF